VALTSAQLGTAQQGYNQFQQRGGRAMWWTPQAANAAAAKGLYPDLQGKALEGWREEFTPWGENIWINPQGDAQSIANPEWLSFVRNYMSQNPGQTQTVQDTFNLPPHSSGGAAPPGPATPPPNAPPPGAQGSLANQVGLNPSQGPYDPWLPSAINNSPPDPMAAQAMANALNRRLGGKVSPQIAKILKSLGLS
jgi:hypothetical protein